VEAKQKIWCEIIRFFSFEAKKWFGTKKCEAKFCEKTSLEAKPKMQCETKRLFLLKQKSVFCVASKRKQLEAKRTI
jgi:hypothetical protein